MVVMLRSSHETTILPRLIEYAGPPPNELGVPCYFGRKGLARQHLVSGWAAPEDTHHWNDGFEAALALGLERMPASRILLRVEGRPYLNATVMRQDLAIYFNGCRLGFWRFVASDGVLIEAVVEPEYWFDRGGTASGTCVFHMPESRRPRDVGDAEDDRLLGFCFQSFMLAAPVPRLRG
jgi:hypothetical protein